MEWKVTEKAIPVSRMLVDDFCECPVDGDFLLPDYCPDVAAILKCTATPAVQSRQVIGDRLQVEGTVRIRLLYLDEERRRVYACEFSQQFGCGFTVKGMPADAVLEVATINNYVNCRATSPRKISVHGTFSVKCRGTVAAEQAVVGTVEQDGWQTKTGTLSYAVPTSSAEKAFSVTEVTDVGAGNPAVESVLMATATPVIHECKQIPGKVILKGELICDTLYASGEGLTTVSHRLPYSLLLDVNGLEDGWTVDPGVTVVATEVVPTTDQTGEMRLLDIRVKLLATVIGIQCGEQTVVTDAYAVAYPLNVTLTDLPTAKMAEVCFKTVSGRQTVEMPGDGEETVAAVWGESAAVVPADGEMPASVRLTACMLTGRPDGTVSFYERPLVFPLEEMGLDEYCAVTLCGMAYAQNGSQLELRPEFAAACHAEERGEIAAVTELSADEGACYPSETAALKVYYAVAGESVWEIAKRYRAVPETVVAENRLTADTIPENRPLLIPMG